MLALKAILLVAIHMAIEILIFGIVFKFIDKKYNEWKRKRNSKSEVNVNPIIGFITYEGVVR